MGFSKLLIWLFIFGKWATVIQVIRAQQSEQNFILSVF
jgi:hypothetical protein